MNNVVFDPELYIAQGGKIIDFDPAYAAREKARRRSIARRKLKDRYEKNERIMYYRRQRKMGLSLTVAATIGFISGEGPLMLLGVLLFFIGISMLFTKKTVLVDSYWYKQNVS